MNDLQLTAVSESALTHAGETVAKAADFVALTEAFLDAQDVAQSSKQTYRRQLKQFFQWLTATDRLGTTDRLRRQDVLAYKNDLMASGKSGYTVSGYVTAVRKLFQFLEAEGVCSDITRNVKGAKRARGFRKDCLTPDQIRDVLSDIDVDTVVGLRDFALLNLLARTGLRTIEIARAKVGDLRQESGEAVLYVQGKGHDTKDDFVLLTNPALKPLRQYLAARGQISDGAPLFASHSDRNPGQSLTTRSLSRVAKMRFRAVGLESPRLTAHSLRHTAITLAIKGGARIEQAQAMARHTSISTTMIYAHNLQRVEDGAEKRINF